MRAAAVVLMLALTASNCQPPEQPAKPPKQKCVEGEPCWDCKTMGNRKCGPGDPKRLVLA